MTYLIEKIPDNMLLTRQQRVAQLTQQQWDIIVVGGGITGAGILKLASQLGLKVLLVEQQDFAWGSSSRSSKMVHGGLRYIAQGQVKLTRESVKERQRLLTQAPYLVTKQSFAISHYQHQFPWPWIFNSLLYIYDLFGEKKQHHYHTKNNYPLLVPNVASKQSQGGTQFYDAMTDDARLVLRLLQEAQQLGGQAINYCKVSDLLYSETKPNCVTGVSVQLENSEQPLNLLSKVVVNATGAWTPQLLKQNITSKLSTKIKMRPLRGSHLIVPSWRLPVASAISVIHPQDKRPVQIFPWQNVTVIGTTDVEHQQSLLVEPRISSTEFDYLLACVDHQFPSIKLTKKDIISTFAGIRPVLAREHNFFLSNTAPSKEKRDHSIWQQEGLITIAGGKLTTFRLIAEQVLKRIAVALNLSTLTTDLPIFEYSGYSALNAERSHISKYQLQHLYGCYGTLTAKFLQQTTANLLAPISYSCHLWAELVWAVNYEQVEHLDDLLLRRTRLGNVLPKGGVDLLDEIKLLCIKALHWSESEWQVEVKRYQQLWKNYYSLPIASMK